MLNWSDWGVQYSTVQYSTEQYSTVQYSTVQYSTVQYSTVQYSTGPTKTTCTVQLQTIHKENHDSTPVKHVCQKEDVFLSGITGRTLQSCNFSYILSKLFFSYQ